MRRREHACCRPRSGSTLYGSYRHGKTYNSTRGLVGRDGIWFTRRLRHGFVPLYVRRRNGHRIPDASATHGRHILRDANATWRRISTAVGLLLHLLIAVVIGVAFASLVRYSTTVMAMIFGIAASVLIWAITTFVAVPLLDPALWRVLPRMRTGWFVSHLLFGICLMVTPSLVTRLSSRTHPDGVRNEDLRAA